MAHEGLDINRLDTVILTTPKRNVTQAIGRIMRKILTETDLKPLIVDFTDKLSVFNSQGETRYKLYKKNNYNIKEYVIGDEYQVSNKDYIENDHKILKKNNISIKRMFSENKLNECEQHPHEEQQKIERFAKNAFDVCLLD